MNNSTCYERLRELREDSDKKQNEVARALFMQTTQYGRYERGERELPLNVAAAAAKYFEVSLDYISGLSNEKKPLPKSEADSEEKIFLDMLRRLGSFERGQIFERMTVLLEKQKQDK